MLLSLVSRVVRKIEQMHQFVETELDFYLFIQNHSYHSQVLMNHPQSEDEPETYSKDDQNEDENEDDRLPEDWV